MIFKLRTKSIPVLFLFLAILTLPFGSKFGELIGFKYVTYLFSAFTILSFLSALFLRKAIITKAVYPFFYYILFIIIHSVFVYSLFASDELFTKVNLYIGNEIVNILLFLVFLSFFICFLILFKEVDLTYINLILSLGYLITLIVGLKDPLSFDSEGTIRFSGGYENPNSFASISLLLLLLNVYMFLNRRGILRIVASMFIVVCFSGLILTQSRSVALALIFLLIFIMAKLNFRKNLNLIVFFSLLVLIFYIIIPEAIFDQFFNRLTSNINQPRHVESRFLIWKDYLSKLPEYFFLGVGKDREILITINDHNTWRVFVSHNLFLSHLIQFGIIGFSLFIWMLVSAFNGIKRYYVFHGKDKDLSTMVIQALPIILAILFFFGSYENSRDIWLIYAIMFGLIGNKNNYEKAANY